MLVCLQRRGIPTQVGPVSLGRSLLLESDTEMPKVRDKLKSRWHLSLTRAGVRWGGPAKGHADRAQPGWRASQGTSCPALVQPSPPNKPTAQEHTIPPPATLGVQSMKWQKDRKHQREAGERPPTPGFLGLLPLCPSALRRSHSKPWCPEGLALHDPLCPVDFTRAGQWSWLPKWESQ